MWFAAPVCCSHANHRRITQEFHLSRFRPRHNSSHSLDDASLLADAAQATPSPEPVDRCATFDPSNAGSFQPFAEVLLPTFRQRRNSQRAP
jgi:hypothetical protein